MPRVRQLAWIAIVTAAFIPQPAWAPSIGGGRPAPHIEMPRVEGRDRDFTHEPTSRTDAETMSRLMFDMSPRGKEYKEDLNRLYAEFDLPHPDKARIDDLVKAMMKSSARRSVVDLMAIFNRGKKQLVGVSPKAPNILFRRPPEEYYDSICDVILDAKLAKAQVEISRDRLMLLSFVRSSEGRTIIKDEVALQYQVRNSFLDRITAGDFEDIDVAAFRSFKGQTVVIVGHVENQDGRVGFEVVARDGETKIVPFTAIEKAADLVGFDYVLMGCETGKFAELGTLNPINDVDAIRAFAKARKVGGTSTFAQLLSDLSSPDLQFIVDLGRVGDRSMTPLGLTRHGFDPERSATGDGTKAKRASVPAAGSPALNQTSLNGGGVGTSTVPPSAGFGGGGASQSGVPVTAGTSMQLPMQYSENASCTVDPDKLDQSKRWIARFPSLESSWRWTFWGSAVLWIAIGLFEAVWRSNLTVRDRSKNLIEFTFVGVAVTTLVALLSDGWLLSRGDAGRLGVVGLGVLAVRLWAGRRFPDHRRALAASMIWVLLAQVPPTSAILVDRAIARCILAMPFPL